MKGWIPSVGPKLLAGGAVALLALLVVVGRAVEAADGESPSSQAVPLKYDLDGQTAAFRSSIASADSTGFGAATTSGLTAFGLGGRQTMAVNGRFSTASETCTVTVAFLNGTTIKDMQQFTLTATAIQDADGSYMSKTTFVDSHGATGAYLTVTTAPTAGTVDLWVGSY